MPETLIEKITSEVSSAYAAATQYRPDNDIACRTKMRRTLQTKLQPYVDSKLIVSYLIICDDSNNVTHDIKQPLMLDVFVEISKRSPRHVISLPLKKQNQSQQSTAPQSNSVWNELNDISDVVVLLWGKLTGKKK